MATDKDKDTKTLLVLPGSPEERTKALHKAMETINKQMGAGTVGRLDGSRSAEPIHTLSTGVLAVDLLTGIGGLPQGRVVEVFGPEASGKTTLTLHAIAAVQAAGGICAFIDAEHALDMSYAKALGVRMDELLLSQPDHGEQALEIVDTLVRSAAVDLIVVDSVAALTPKAEIAGEMGDQQPGLHARMMSQALRKLTPHVHKTNTCVLFINQIRYKIGVLHGSPETTTGGNALKFFASLRLDVRRIQTIKDEGGSSKDAPPIGARMKIKAVKNKLAAPFREVEVASYFGRGIDPGEDLLARATEAGLVDKSGSWLTVGGERCQGTARAVQWLLEHPAEASALRLEVLAKAGIRPPAANRQDVAMHYLKKLPRSA